MNESNGKPQGDGGEQKNSGWLWFVAGSLFLFMAMSMQSPPSARYEQLAFSDFLADVETGRVTDVTFKVKRLPDSLRMAVGFRAIYRLAWM